MGDYNSYTQNDNQRIDNSLNSPQSNKKIWLLILIPVFVIFLGGIIFFFIRSSSKTISENEFLQGTNFQLREGKEVRFIINDEKYTTKTRSVYNNSLNLEIRNSDGQLVTGLAFFIGEEKKSDLDRMDGFYDILIKLNSINKSVPEFYIKKIHESICTEDWNCSEWSSCPEQGGQTRTCADLNSCGTTKNKPSTTQSCTYVETCLEDWECTNWSQCTNGQQTRICTDSNSCGTTKNKPNVQQSCVLQTINCGSNTQTPGTVGNQPNFDCFIDASENCEPAKLLNTITIKIFGMLSTSTTYMELKGVEANKCIYYQRTESSSVKFTDEMKQTMLDGGSTQEEIDQQEQTANESAQQTVGLEKTCKFEKNDLTAMLNRWKEGSLSTEDWDVAEC